ncbi:MAG: Tunicamycin resistance protein [Paenibacillaceae bacterium]|jgi:hypothetical protein|nr:Tunicamycin resistance protein [Paenibacillaceae bacterium]
MKNKPKELRKGNFQDEPEWRRINYEIINSIASEYDGTLIIPMTIINESYYHEIITRLRSEGHRIDHYVLGASGETLVRRGRTRLCFGNSWSVRQIPHCLSGFENPVFENQIVTDGLSVEQIIDFLAARSNLDLLPDHANPLQKWLRRRKVQLRHIRMIGAQ